MTANKVKPMMTMWFKRAKSFVTDSENGTKKFLAQPGPTPRQVPMWVAETATFKRGVLDCSIVNLTPPAMMPGYVVPPAAAQQEPEKDEEDVVDDDAKDDDAKDDDAKDDDDAVQDPPQVPFGGQPMTPVQQATKIGNMRGGAKRAR